MNITKPTNVAQTKPHELQNRSTTLESEGLVQLNVSGMNYITFKETLEEFPRTLLGNEKRRRHYFVKSLNAYFFDRNRDCFEAILHYYQSGGILFRPTHIPMDIFIEEARFFEISEDVLSNLHKLEGYAIDNVEEEKKKLEKDFQGKWQRKVWLLMDSPDSSLSARIIGCWSVLVILVSMITFCLETLPAYHTKIYVGNHLSTSPPITNTSKNTNSSAGASTQNTVIEVINVIEVVSVIWFCLEYVLRLASSPNKWVFLKSFLNLIDLLAILPFFIVIIVQQKTGSSLAVVRVARLARILRIFKLSRHSMGLQILGSTLKASLNELGMMLCVICFSVILFSSAIYYAEHKDNEMMFKSIPGAFWYTLVTMTTVGYGDKVPLTIPGKLIGGFCAITGVLTIAMIIPIIVTNFEFFYKRDRIMIAHEEQKQISLKHSIRKIKSPPENIHLLKSSDV